MISLVDVDVELKVTMILKCKIIFSFKFQFALFAKKKSCFKQVALNFACKFACTVLNDLQKVCMMSHFAACFWK